METQIWAPRFAQQMCLLICVVFFLFSNISELPIPPTHISIHRKKVLFDETAFISLMLDPRLGLLHAQLINPPYSCNNERNSVLLLKAFSRTLCYSISSGEYLIAPFTLCSSHLCLNIYMALV